MVLTLHLDTFCGLTTISSSITTGGFGYSVSISPKYVLVGMPFATTTVVNHGLAQIFEASSQMGSISAYGQVSTRNKIISLVNTSAEGVGAGATTIITFNSIDFEVPSWNSYYSSNGIVNNSGRTAYFYVSYSVESSNPLSNGVVYCYLATSGTPGTSYGLCGATTLPGTSSYNSLNGNAILMVPSGQTINLYLYSTGGISATGNLIRMQAIKLFTTLKTWRAYSVSPFGLTY